MAFVGCSPVPPRAPSSVEDAARYLADILACSALDAANSMLPPYETWKAAQEDSTDQSEAGYTKWLTRMRKELALYLPGRLRSRGIDSTSFSVATVLQTQAIASQGSRSHQVALLKSETQEPPAILMTLHETVDGRFHLLDMPRLIQKQ